VRRRIRRLVRPRVFNNARTATRNLDLPLAICDPIFVPLFLVHSRILASAWRRYAGAQAGLFVSNDVPEDVLRGEPNAQLALLLTHARRNGTI
jgi:hypothetical protein